MHSQAQGTNKTVIPQLEQEIGIMEKQWRREKRRKGFWMLVWGKRGQLWQDLERVLKCQIWFPSPSCSSFCQSTPRLRGQGGGESQGGVHKPSNAYEKLVTLISLRALQLCHGIILAVTLIDWCQRPPILSKRAIMSFNAWLLIDMF